MANKLAESGAAKAAQAVWHTEVSRGSQDVIFQQLLAAPRGDRLRITIRSDSYVEQSFAKVEVWRDGWQVVWAVDGTAMHTQPKLYYQHPPATEAAFTLDRNKLYALACAILDKEA